MSKQQLSNKSLITLLKMNNERLADLLFKAYCELDNATFYLEEEDAKDVRELRVNIKFTLDAIGWRWRPKV